MLRPSRRVPRSYEGVVWGAREVCAGREPERGGRRLGLTTSWAPTEVKTKHGHTEEKTGANGGTRKTLGKMEKRPGKHNRWRKKNPEKKYEETE